MATRCARLIMLVFMLIDPIARSARLRTIPATNTPNIPPEYGGPGSTHLVPETDGQAATILRYHRDAVTRIGACCGTGVIAI